MKKKLIIIFAVICALLVFKLFGFDDYLSFAYIKQHQAAFTDYYEQFPIQALAIYFSVYVLITALSIPAANILTLLGGALFGFGQGLLIISFASTIGATFAFLISRNLLRDFIQKKFGDRLKKVNEGFQKDGAYYLLSMRLVPIIPFWFINLSMGLTQISVKKYYIVSQTGMLAGTAVYVNAGVQLSQLESVSGIISPSLMLSFLLLGIFPLVAKYSVNKLIKK